MVKHIKGVLSWDKQGNELILFPEKGKVSVSITNDNLVRFRYTKNTEFTEEENYVLDCDVNLTDFTVNDLGQRLEISTDKLRVHINLDNFQLAIYDGNNNEVISADKDFLSLDDRTTTIRLALSPDEEVYGLGQDPMGNLNHHDKERRVWHQYGHIRRSGNIGVPFMLSSKKYGVFLNTSYPSRFDIGAADPPEYDRLGILMAEFPDNWTLDSEDKNPENTAIILNEDDVDLWFIVKDSMDEIINSYYGLTGKAALLPKWAYGFIQCNCRYRSQDEMLEIAAKMREKNVPCDVLLIDWLWFREFGDLKWDERYWHSTREMFSKLKDLGFKVMMAQHPFISKASINFEEFGEKGYLNINPSESRYTYDHSNPEAREHWWSRIKEFYDEGIKGYWTDMGELEEHHIGTKSHLGDRDKLHNIYMTLWTKGLYEGQRRDFGERFFALNRATYPGIQKYGTVLWSGDIDASWEVMKEQVVIGQGAAMSGIPFWSTDIGGFLTVEGYTAELFVRWLQWNLFCPIFRVHGTRPGNEIWSFGEQAEDISRYYVKMRYKLLPYIYSMADKLRQQGSPMMRAMVMDYSDDEKASESIYQFMFGDSLLVSPVLDKGDRQKETYLPKEPAWYDYYTDKRYEGGQTVNISAPLEKLPLFVKGGSIIPMSKADDRLFVSEELETDIELHIYPGQSASTTLYDDDGVTFDYETTGYTRTGISYTEESDTRKIMISKPEGEMELTRTYTVIVHDSDEPVGLEGLNYSYDAASRKLVIADVTVESKEDLEIVYHVKPVIIHKNGVDNNVDFFVDTDLENEGRLTVNLSWVNDLAAAENLTVSAKFSTAPYWTIEKEDNSFHNAKMYSKQIIHHEEIKAMQLGQTGHLCWTALPVAEYLPASHEGMLHITVLDGDKPIYEKEQRVNWGSGFVTRWSVAGCFKNDNDKGMETVYGPEDNPDLPYYEYAGKTIPWIKDNLYEFNCFGYVELRRYGSYEGPGEEGMNGITYLRNTAYCEEDTYALLNVSSELKMKVWLNDELVHSSDDLVIDRTENKPLHFKKGYNKLLVKVGVYTEKPYSGREFGFNMRLLNVDNPEVVENSIIFKH